MSKEDLIGKLQALYTEAVAAGEDNAAAVIAALVGSLLGGTDDRLADKCQQHSKSALAALSARKN